MDAYCPECGAGSMFNGMAGDDQCWLCPACGHEWVNPDPVLDALRQTRKDLDRVDRDIRVLLAYGREFTRPRPYRLTDLADAAGMSVSGVRTAYTRQHVEEVRQILGARHARQDTNGTASGCDR